MNIEKILPTRAELEKAFDKITSVKLEVSTIICSDCGNIYEFSENSKPCTHQTAMFNEWRSDPKFKEW